MVDRLIETLVALTAAFSGACLLVWVLREPCRKLAGSAFVYWIWLLVPVAMLAAVLPALPHSTPAAPLAAQQFGQPLLAQVAVLPQPPSLADAALSIWRGLTPYLAGAWGFGLVAFLCRIALMQHRFIGGLGRLTRDPRRPNVFYSERAGVSPSVIGMLRSRIVLPADFTQLYGQDEQTLIMAHERTHVRERHPTAGAFGVLIVAVQWFNPLAYMALSLFRIDQELACDAAVVTAHPASRAAYAKAMMKARIGIDYNPPLAYCWISRLSLPMKDRISLLKARPPTPERRAAAVAMLALIASGSAMAAYAMVPHPEISLNLRPSSNSGPVSAPVASAEPIKTTTTERSARKVMASRSTVSVVKGGLGNGRLQADPEPVFDITTSDGLRRQQLFDMLTDAANRSGGSIPAPQAIELVQNGVPTTVLGIPMGRNIDREGVLRVLSSAHLGNGAPELGLPAL